MLQCLNYENVVFKYNIFHSQNQEKQFIKSSAFQRISIILRLIVKHPWDTTFAFPNTKEFS